MMKIKPDVTLIMEFLNNSEAYIFFDFDRCNLFCEQIGIKPITLSKATTLACVCTKKDKEGVTWQVGFIPISTSPETVCHECLHLAYGLLRYYGINIDEELLAYMQQHLARQFFKAIAIKPKRKR